MKNSSDGVLVHRIMESLRYGEDIDYSSWSEEWFGERAGEVQEAIKFVQNVTIPPMEELLKVGFVEWGFQMRVELTGISHKFSTAAAAPLSRHTSSNYSEQERSWTGIIEGQVDLWGEVENSCGEKEVWLVDYKSGSEKYIEKAFKQLDFYAQALRKYGVRGEIQQAVIYPLSRIVQVRSYTQT